MNEEAFNHRLQQRMGAEAAHVALVQRAVEADERGVRGEAERAELEVKQAQLAADAASAAAADAAAREAVVGAQSALTAAEAALAAVDAVRGQQLAEPTNIMQPAANKKGRCCVLSKTCTRVGVNEKQSK